MNFTKSFMIIVVASLAFSAVLIADRLDNSTAITEQNWSRHPRIIEIRKMYEEIRAGLDNKSLTYVEKDFSKLPRDCRGTYPIEKLAVAYDKKGRVRLYIHAQRISHDDLQTDPFSAICRPAGGRERSNLRAACSYPCLRTEVDG